MCASDRGGVKGMGGYEGSEKRREWYMRRNKAGLKYPSRESEEARLRREEENNLK